MKIINKKGFSLIMAIMIVTVLVIMAAGFFQITDHSNRNVARTTNSLRIYWAAESSSNYNVHWWINQPDSVRAAWPFTYTYTPPAKSKFGSSSYSDLDGITVDGTKFDNATGTADGNKFYLHQSSLLEGNAGNTNSELEDFNGYKLVTVRYKGARASKPEQAVWILDSYAWDPNTGDIANVVMANVWNYIRTSNDAFDNSELINASLLGLSGFHGVKGRFNEQDYRYGKVYFADIVHFDYTTGATKYGPTFYGLVQSASEDISSYGSAANTPYTNLTSIYSHGLYLNNKDLKSDAQADVGAAKSLKGGYAPQVKPLDLDYVVWSWDEIEKHGAENRIWTPEMRPDKFMAGDNIKAVLTTVTDATGIPSTKARLYKSTGAFSNQNSSTSWIDTKIDLPIGDGAGKFTGIAVSDAYGNVGLQGRSAWDFSLVTETSQVLILDDFYLYEMEAYKQTLEALGTSEITFKPTAEKLKELWDEMVVRDSKGHLAVIAGLGITADTYEKGWPPIWIDKEEFIFSTSSYLTQCGELGAKGVGNTKLRFWNVGSVMVLDQQEIMSGPADTAQKWPKVFIQDQRYLRDGEPLPPFCGEGPDANPGGSLKNLNPSHTWSKGVSGQKTDKWETVVWRNGQPSL